MPDPTLADYTYQFRDNPQGVLLNDPNFPATSDFCWDVEKVEGLDLPPISPDVYDYDGADGGNISAKYLGTRTIAFTGKYWQKSGDVDARVDALKMSLLRGAVAGGLRTARQLHIKQPGRVQVYSTCWVTQFRMDVDTARRYGSGSFFLQFQAEDPLLYADNADQTLSNATAYSINNSGTADTGFTVTFTGSLLGVTKIAELDDGRSLEFNATTGAGDVTTVDTRLRQLKINGVDHTELITDPDWWYNLAQEPQTIRVTRGGGTATIALSSTNGWY